MSSEGAFYAGNESKSVLARDLDEYRDSGKIRKACFHADNGKGEENGKF